MPGLPPLPGALLAVGTGLDLRSSLERVVDGAAEPTGARHAARDGLTGVRTPPPPRAGAVVHGRRPTRRPGARTARPPRHPGPRPACAGVPG
ncbi:hypothetical protein JS756_11630 [Streptomyces actuosus]|uniref:Uncharacterized protein n=1 Tax=Streptomyces actuosus TaxID=1885 RepID=A0ABS2VNR0_STRAS|nr:hypothetical protein [Streptomyces actuosus]MBN0044748.1 hypothetical protein [Streptomyces actuosus]